MGIGVIWMAWAPGLAWGQWTGGPTGPIYYNGGNVGVGTTSPLYPMDLRTTAHDASQLHVSGYGTDDGGYLGSWAPGFTALSSGIAYNGTNWIAKNTGWSIVSMNPVGGMRFHAGTGATVGNTVSVGGPAMVISNGNVGIGTTNPQYLLSVNGTLGAKDITVTNTGWSDYVFDPGYRLKPLSEVDEYIQANHHLPDIPSQAEVEAKGVNVGEMQSKLLAKIEELTLHMIRQEKENQELRERLARLERASAAAPGR
jgi:hypothetical protein